VRERAADLVVLDALRLPLVACERNRHSPAVVAVVDSGDHDTEQRAVDASAIEVVARPPP
jgi:hypothetical protein